MNKVSGKSKSISLSFLGLIFLVSLHSRANAACENSIPLVISKKTVVGAKGFLQFKQIIYKCDDNKRGVALALDYEGAFVNELGRQGAHFQGPFSFWIKVNDTELTHDGLLIGTDPEYWRNATWNVTACLASILNNGGIGGVGCSTEKQQTSDQGNLLLRNIKGDKISAWDIQVAVKYEAGSRWDNNNTQNYRVHFNENSLNKPRGDSDN